MLLLEKKKRKRGAIQVLLYISLLLTLVLLKTSAPRPKLKIATKFNKKQMLSRSCTPSGVTRWAWCSRASRTSTSSTRRRKRSSACECSTRSFVMYQPNTFILLLFLFSFFCYGYRENEFSRKLGSPFIRYFSPCPSLATITTAFTALALWHLWYRCVHLWANHFIVQCLHTNFLLLLFVWPMFDIYKILDRVLWLAVDFDKLLMQQRFKSIEKIKTIAATYMAASGLNPNHNKVINTSAYHFFWIIWLVVSKRNSFSDPNSNDFRQIFLNPRQSKYHRPIRGRRSHSDYVPQTIAFLFFL